MATVQPRRDTDLALLSEVLAALPDGHFFSRFEGARWSVVSVRRAGGAIHVVEGHRLDRMEVISGNVYRTGRGLTVRPCEVATTRFLQFVVEQRPIPPRVEPGEPLVRHQGLVRWILHGWGARRLRRRARDVLFS